MLGTHRRARQGATAAAVRRCRGDRDDRGSGPDGARDELRRANPLAAPGRGEDTAAARGGARMADRCAGRTRRRGRLHAAGGKRQSWLDACSGEGAKLAVMIGPMPKGGLSSDGRCRDRGFCVNRNSPRRTSRGPATHRTCGPAPLPKRSAWRPNAGRSGRRGADQGRSHGWWAATPFSERRRPIAPSVRGAGRTGRCAGRPPPHDRH